MLRHALNLPKGDNNSLTISLYTFDKVKYKQKGEVLKKDFVGTQRTFLTFSSHYRFILVIVANYKPLSCAQNTQYVRFFRR
jgi:hypothetical protein